MQEFWDQYSNLVAQWLTPLAAGDGYSEDEIAAAESQLGIRLPALLREFYGKAGRRADIISSYNVFPTLDKLAVDVHGVLSIYWENQHVAEWEFPSTRQPIAMTHPCITDRTPHTALRATGVPG